MGDVLRKEAESEEFSKCLRRLQRVWQEAKPSNMLTGAELLTQLEVNEEARAEEEDFQQWQRTCETYRKVLRAGLEFRELRAVSAKGLDLLARLEQGETTAGQSFADVWEQFLLEAGDILEGAKLSDQQRQKKKRPTAAEMDARNSALIVAAVKYEQKHDCLPTVQEMVKATRYTQQEIYATDAYKEGRIVKHSAKGTAEMAGGSVVESEYVSDHDDQGARATRSAKTREAELAMWIDEQEKDQRDDDKDKHSI
jgi:hypothetical protein